MKPILVIGMGNPILSDDAIGPKIVKALQAKHPLPHVEYEIKGVGGLEMMEFTQGYETVIFIDAMKTRDGVPGTVYRFDLSTFKETLHLSNFHDLNFIAAFEVGKRMGVKVPKNIEIIGIEIVEDLVFSDEFSPRIQERYEAIFEEIESWFLDYVNQERGQLTWGTSSPKVDRHRTDKDARRHDCTEHC